MRRPRRIVVRCRLPVAPGTWEVRARVERMVEPALLLVLRDAPTHGYDLAEGLAELVPEARIDLGNLYRLLRSLEAEGIVTSHWSDEEPGRPKRIYDLTPAGLQLLDAWAESLQDLEAAIAAFLRRHEQGEST